VTLSGEGRRRLRAATPTVRALEAAIERDVTTDQLATVKAWLVASAKRLEGTAVSRDAEGPLSRGRRP
jgi:hypothetical protein